MLEAKKAELEAKLAEVASDHEKLQAISAQLGALVDELDTKSERWLELAEYA